MNDSEAFKSSCISEVEQQGQDDQLAAATRAWFNRASHFNYSYHFEWLGRPIIQYPQDIVGVQQLLWNIQPDLVIETGIARGGSLIFYASILELIAQCGGPQDGSILGIDIDIREHNRQAILSHPMSKRIEMLQGSSIDSGIIKEVHERAKQRRRILVCLDSNHTHEHVLEELRVYAPLVSPGSYIIVFDTVIEDLPSSLVKDRPWAKGNNAKTAVFQYLKELNSQSTLASDGQRLRLEIDRQIESQLLITVAPSGYLRRI